MHSKAIRRFTGAPHALLLEADTRRHGPYAVRSAGAADATLPDRAARHHGGGHHRHRATAQETLTPFCCHCRGV
jgi:hypothetical protein